MREAGAVDCVQADATRCGGITEWLRVAAVAAAHHLELSAHCAGAHRADVLRRHPRPDRRQGPAGPHGRRERADPAPGRRRALPAGGPMTTEGCAR
ncbi:MAG: hypothetical protein L0H64_03055 [Pseudonocardia sp.]|nr:hypothetical protein [Pseudonocardia sp.]